MSFSDSKNNSQGFIQRSLFRLGLSLILISVGLSFADLIGIFEMPEFILFGESALKTYARIAVLGCAAAAIGSWDPISPEHKTTTQPMRQNSKE